MQDEKYLEGCIQNDGTNFPCLLLAGTIHQSYLFIFKVNFVVDKDSKGQGLIKVWSLANSSSLL